MDSPVRRRIVLIDHRFQLGMAALLVAVQALLTALFAGGLYLFLDSELEAGLASAHARYKTLASMLFPIVGTLSLFGIVLSALLLTIFVVVLSHRIAGPLFRFRAALEQVARRDLAPLTRIRKDDQLGPVADALGAAVGTVAGDIAALKEAQRRLQLQLDAGDLAGARAAAADLAARLHGYAG